MIDRSLPTMLSEPGSSACSTTVERRLPVIRQIITAHGQTPVAIAPLQGLHREIAPSPTYPPAEAVPDAELRHRSCTTCQPAARSDDV
jgi:hypothetical protein